MRFLDLSAGSGAKILKSDQNKLSGPPFRRQNRLFSQSLTSSFWSYLRLICNQISQLWVSPEVSGGCPKSDFDSMNILNTLVGVKANLDNVTNYEVFYKASLRPKTLSQLWVSPEVSGDAQSQILTH